MLAMEFKAELGHLGSAAQKKVADCPASTTLSQNDALGRHFYSIIMYNSPQNLHVVGAVPRKLLPIGKREFLRHFYQRGSRVPESVPAHAIPVRKVQLLLKQLMQSGFAMDAGQVKNH
jgi:hypothetical protein